MHYSLTTTSPPTSEPVSLALAKTHLRIDHDEEDELVKVWISAARRLAEEYTGKRWATQTLRMYLPGFPDGAIELPVEPVSSVTSVTYKDTAGDSQTLVSGTDYQTWLDHSPPLILPEPDADWPDTEFDRAQAVTVTFVAGGGEVPDMVKSAILLTLGYWDGNRGDGENAAEMGLPAGAKRLLDLLWTGSYR